MVENVLILGSPRSGTTLLAAMISRHSEICILMENLRGADEDILSKKITGLKLCVPNQIELKKKATYLNRIARRLPFLKDFAFIQNMPLSLYSIRDYQKTRKNLHIIGIIRDPRNVIASIQKRGRQAVGTAEYRWARSIEILHKLLIENPNQISLVLFENIVQQPDQVISRLLKNLRVSFEAPVLDGYRHTPQYHNNGIDQTKATACEGDGYQFMCVRSGMNIMEKYKRLQEVCL